jgi:FMN phosphatase YigB (HAD superfamily)
VTTLHDMVFLLDVDNTLLDNDAVQNDLRERLAHDFGAAGRDRYWGEFERLREELGYADYLGALQNFRLDGTDDPRLMLMSSFILDYPFADRIYPGALDAIEHLRPAGLVVVLSDGDAVLQPRKIERSGLWKAVDGQVLIYVRKEQRLADVQRRYPARHYVMVDDKIRILASMKSELGGRLTTVFPRQGHYALDTSDVARYPAADVTIERIGELSELDAAALPGAAAARRAV